LLRKKVALGGLKSPIYQREWTGAASRTSGPATHEVARRSSGLHRGRFTMTVQQQQDTRSVVPTQSQGPDSATGTGRQSAMDGRYRRTQDDEAYRRSEMEQAQTDIAAGW
jgi:hypothetical protein